MGRAREYARAQLIGWDMESLVDTTELLVSELVTNALRYGEGEIRLRLLLDRTLVCEVWDAGRSSGAAAAPATPTRAVAASSSSACSSAAWGSRPHPPGKQPGPSPPPLRRHPHADPAEALLGLFSMGCRRGAYARTVHITPATP
ncbi:PAS domain S-box-containing protein OS=Streptomyces griseomycini OX=66895 GN=FHS37_001204 PE=4 SV=1 [Streptomyces griseomycini]